LQIREALTAAQQQGQAVACERCAGSGTVTATDTTRGPDGHEFDADCPHCDGTGDVHRPDGEWRGRCNCDQPTQQGGGEVCIAAHWLENIAAAASLLEASGDVFNVREAAALRKLIASAKDTAPPS